MGWYIKARNTLSGRSPFIDLLMVCQVEVGEAKGDIVLEGEEIKCLKVGVSKAEGEKCPRCWVYFPHSEFVELPDGQKVCKRCYKALKDMGLV